MGAGPFSPIRFSNFLHSEWIAVERHDVQPREPFLLTQSPNLASQGVYARFLFCRRHRGHEARILDEQS